MDTGDGSGWLEAAGLVGEAVFRGRMWILGGWFDSYSAPPRDVWSSENGRDWVLETEQAPWKHSDLPMVTVFRDRMWLMGGWYNGRLEGHGASNEVWSTGDGREWRQDVAAAPGVLGWPAVWLSFGTACGCWAGRRIITSVTGTV